MTAMDKDLEQLVKEVREGNLDPDDLKAQLDQVADAAAEKAVEEKQVDVTQRERINRLARKASQL